jgi:hypothetical protein
VTGRIRILEYVGFAIVLACSGLAIAFYPSSKEYCSYFELSRLKFRRVFTFGNTIPALQIPKKIVNLFCFQGSRPVASVTCLMYQV